MDGIQNTDPPGRGGRCPTLRRLVPIGFGAEAWTLLILSGPLFLFQVLTFMIYIVSSVFCGHLGKVELASVTLSVAFINVCGVSIGSGLSMACDTLMSQSFGSPNKKHVGVILQRGVLVLLLCCFPCWALFLNTQQILLLFRQDPDVSRCPSEVNFLGQEGPWLCPWAPSPGSLQHVGAAPLDCRLSWPRCVGAGKACPQTCAARMPLGQRLPPSQRAGPGWLRSFWFSCRLTHEYVLIFVPALPASFLYGLLAKYLQNQGIIWPQVLSGVVGNCINCLANYVLVSLLSLGVRGSAYANTISQFVQAIFLFLYIVQKKLHLETWAGWSSRCLQDWGPFLSLAVPSMLMICLEWWAYEIGSFLMGLLSVLDLSAQAVIYEVATVIYMIPMGLSMAVCVRVGTALGAADTVQAKRSAISVGAWLVVGILLSVVKNKLGHIFTNDEEVIALVNEVLPIYIVFHLFEAICCVYGGILRGSGKQAFGAVVNAITNYIVGLPLGIVLTFVVGMRIMGLWLGMLACVLLAAAAFIVYTARMNWKLAAEEAQKHAGLQQQSAESTVDTARVAPCPGPEDAAVSSVARSGSPGVTLTTYSRPGCHLDLFRTPEVAHALTAPASRLSVKQLALRRGAALGAASATLAVGLVIRVLATRH
ncbi:multidrug and toxin extrusion protein 2 isoform X2 [Equus przewalskii]|uniref:Multidrug and toxin extrusion protein n=1 Tax=Equus przewalskii TaxID=9798 RepID=A0ABM4JUP8_EQUPR